MSASIFLFTPPFTQLNTPYPATAYLKGFLNTKGISSVQADLGIEIILALFSREGLQQLFAQIDVSSALPENIQRIITLREHYIQTVDSTIDFLQGRNATLAHRICKRDFLPEAERFSQLDDLHTAFGSMGIQDKARHLATMYLEDLGDLITACVDPHFGFSRYAERLGRSAGSFDVLYNALQQPHTLIDNILRSVLEKHMNAIQPELVAISVPFPGNLFAALRCGAWIKEKYPGVKVAMGGGYPNTELRSLSDPRVFEFLDFITLDDGEAPVENLLRYIKGEIQQDELKRTFLLTDSKVTYINHTGCRDYRQDQLGTPDYSDFLLDKYISVIEVPNLMHSLWSDGRWNKLTMAHGCYWGKCTFCDISLPYIKLYEPITAQLLCDRMETIIAQTGGHGFHFVDEAAPPALMRELALEIIRRGLVVSWWANIRFEKSFTRDLCLLLKASGCIAVSGGLEVASDRLLAMIDKGITVAQVARVNHNFTAAGIMVHAYLMYGFPTQTAQETIDSLEMVRQMFEAGILQSAFWHQFAMTAHSPVGLNPEKFHVINQTPVIGSFANNDLEHADPTGTDHDSFSYGLKKSLLNYMHGQCLEYPLHKWFDFKVPRTTIPQHFITSVLEEQVYAQTRPNTKVAWLGTPPTVMHHIKSKKGSQWEVTILTFINRQTSSKISVDRPQGEWFVALLDRISRQPWKTMPLQEVKKDYENAGLEDFELFWDNKPVNTLHRFGLLHL